MDSLTNTGQMPINGGHASAANGDTTFNNRTGFGGITYNNGINPTYVIIGVVALAGLYFATR
ncbi:hypothetical protein [Thalassotalea euphylliae]|uniref:Uncharacterized protein n=1 Tax=Thalassotalea euphylliae TaxID=1655234 RepID=A0A3E0U3A5_9GAMM|nr:hypothetical protein [Thalassotalea euphylliae]REL31077.1 hypothetical protein DXX94_10320 [Thalassotalea euphylliae]